MTKFTVEDTANYAAQVIRVPAPFPLPKADRLVGVGVFGSTIVVSKDWADREGSLAVFFPAECQLSLHLTAHANLHRHSDLNTDTTQTGYLEDNRRVRAIKLRGTISNGLLLPVTEVARIFGAPEDAFTEGTVFDHIDGVEVARKYRVKEPVQVTREAGKLKRAFRRVDEKLFPAHIETDQYARNEHLLDDDDVLIVTQKLHGTSWRGGRVPVRRKLTWLERLAARVGVTVATTTLDVVFGSRKVIKDPHNPNQDHFYGTDLWSEFGQAIEDRIPANMVVYGELVGWTSDGAPIQHGHTYQVPAGTAQLYVYRVAVITETGDLYDLSWDQVRTWCGEHGFAHVPELWRGFKRDFDPAQFREKNFAREQVMHARYPDAPVPLSADGTGADEGIAIRVDRGGRIPMLFKIKNDSFYLWETTGLDLGEVDLESAA